ncbi:hypothetical protein [Nonomuraea phyllanthi]|uniref:hypothetical protein n=1 Tax=Nonomuraea phyllanthi TaxID=2219224 RepID=UPI001D138CAF|nr:hypothetical protein [Nonomuraea phyllanthi]
MPTTASFRALRCGFTDGRKIFAGSGTMLAHGAIGGAGERAARVGEDHARAGDWSRRLGTAAGESLWTLLGSAGPGAVLESPWLAPLRPVVLAGLERAGVEPASEVREVWCEVPTDLARLRYERRARHAIHLDVEVGDERWREWAAGARPLSLGTVICVDTSKPVDISGLAGLCQAPQ